MSRFYLNHNKENKLEAVYSSAEKESVISGDYLTSFLNMVMKMKDITVNVNKADNMIVLEAGKDKIIIKDAKKFLELEKDSNFVKFLKEKVISTPKPKKKIKKDIHTGRFIPFSPEYLGSLFRKAISEHDEVVLIMLHSVMLLYVVINTNRTQMDHGHPPGFSAGIAQHAVEHLHDQD